MSKYSCLLCVSVLKHQSILQVSSKRMEALLQVVKLKVLSLGKQESTVLLPLPHNSSKTG